MRFDPSGGPRYAMVGVPDRISVRLALVDAATGEALDSAGSDRPEQVHEVSAAQAQ